MSQQSFFGSVSLTNGTSAAVNVDLGFIPGRIELINLTSVTTPTDTKGWKAVWQYGMAQASAVVTTYKTATNINDVTTLVTTNGISLLNQLGSEVGQYGAVVSGFSNAASGVITVDSTYNASITAGCIIRVANLADDQSGVSLNGDYYVASVTSTTITVGTIPASVSWSQSVLNNKNTAASGVYVSGGVVTVLQNANAIIPNPPHNIYSNVPSWYNEAIQGFTIGTSCFAGAGTTDIILVSAWDMMQP